MKEATMLRGPTLYTMAWRNLWRNRRRTIITISSLAFGVMLAVIFTALTDQSMGDAIDLAARMSNGHVTIQDRDYRDSPAVERTVAATSDLRARLGADADVIEVVPRITGQLVLATANDSFGAGFIALDPALDDAHSFAPLGQLVAGRLFATDDPQGIVLGKTLAANLGARVGKKVVYTLTDKRGEIVSGLGRVSGIVATGSTSADAALCLLPIGAVRTLLGYGGDEATQLAVYVRDQRRAALVARRLAGVLPPNAVALSWAEVNPELAGFVTMKVVGSQVLEALVVLLIAAGIFNTLFMSVMERLREFGILLAIGFSPGRLFRLVVWESLWLALVGLAVGVVVTLPVYRYLHTHGIDMSARVGRGQLDVAGGILSMVIRATLYPDHAAMIAVAIVGVTLLSGLYPAWRAARVQPVDAIKLGY
jgi:ABC-type lipoprotein release transport system permease subunit